VDLKQERQCISCKRWKSFRRIRSKLARHLRKGTGEERLGSGSPFAFDALKSGTHIGGPRR